MSESFNRRRFITTGLAGIAGASGVVGGVYLADRYGLIPPDYTGVIGIGETLTYATQRLVTSGHSLAREFKRNDISKVAPVNGPHPVDAKYQALMADGFKNWRLSIEGLVARPVSFSLEELKQLPAESHIILHACEEGWSYIAECEALPADHGAPVRLRLSRHFGYKNTKYLSRILITNDRDFYRKGRGTWYGGI